MINNKGKVHFLPDILSRISEPKFVGLIFDFQPPKQNYIKLEPRVFVTTQSSSKDNEKELNAKYEIFLKELKVKSSHKYKNIISFSTEKMKILKNSVRVFFTSRYLEDIEDEIKILFSNKILTINGIYHEQDIILFIYKS